MKHLVKLFSEGKADARWICVPCRAVELGTEDNPNYQEALKDLRCNPDAKEAQRRHYDNEMRQWKVGFSIPRGFQCTCTNGFVYSVFYDV